MYIPTCNPVPAKTYIMQPRSLVVLANVVGLACTSTNMASFIKNKRFVAKSLEKLRRDTQLACIYTFPIVPIVLIL